MNASFITPIQPLTSLEGINGANKVKGQTGSELFKDVFQNAINNVTSTEQELSQQQYLLSTGQIDDAHTVPIAASQAQMAVDLLVQLRNKAMESYNNIMSIGV